MPDAHGGSPQRVRLRAAIGNYPHTEPLLSGRISSPLLSFDFADTKPIHRAFAPMVREQRFDLSEIAIATFLQAKAYGKPLVLLPVVLAARFQQSALLCRPDSEIGGPQDLAGRKVGVRAYSQTTGVWLRGILADDYGVRPEDVRWVTFEDAHVAEYRDPPFVQRASPGKDLVAMLRERELDAIIVGNEMPAGQTLRTVFPDPDASAEAFWREHGFVPVNHMLTLRRELVASRPEVVAELVRVFRESKAATGVRAPDGRDPLAIGRAAVQPAIDVAARYAAEQGLIPRQLSPEEVWEGLPALPDENT